MENFDKLAFTTALKHALEREEQRYKEFQQKVDSLKTGTILDKAHFFEWHALDPLIAAEKIREYNRYLDSATGAKFNFNLMFARLVKEIIGLSMWASNKSTSVIDSCAKEYRLEALSFILDLMGKCRDR